jgi:glycosyltransferase involved in cell wall biosynthesis
VTGVQTCALPICLIRQSFRGFEIIVMDGNSTDGTPELARKMLEGGEVEFTIRSQPDRGVYDAMNHGIALARGEWLYFMGADDTLRNDGSLEEIRPHLEDPQVDLVIAKVDADNASGGVLPVVDVPHLMQDNICHQGILYRRALFERLGSYRLRYPLYADWDFNLRCLLAGVSHKVVDITLARYATTGLSNQGFDLVFLRERGVLEPWYRFRFGRGWRRWGHLGRAALAYGRMHAGNMVNWAGRHLRRGRTVA